VTTRIARHILPDTARVDDGGRLSVGGVDLLDLAAEHGTPLFAYDEATLRARCREARAAFDDGVAYGSKAFLCTAVARLAHEEGMHVDVASGGELEVAVAAGVPPERIVLHGNNKSLDELRRARELGVRPVVDSFDEIDRLESLFAADGVAVRALVRVTPGVQADTHAHISTGQVDSKFGFGMEGGAAAEAIDRLARSDAVDLDGVHVHIGSQIVDLRSFEETVDAVAGFFAPLDLPELCLGGGLAIPYTGDERPPSISEWGAAAKRACRAAGISARLTAEPGRAIAATAGITLYEVGTIKEIPGVRTYASVDGGMSDNPRPILYDARYEAFLPRAADAERPRTVTIAGKHCESGDVLIRDAQLPADLAVGDVLAVPATGAYGYSMASNYNKVPRPAVVFVADGESRVVVRRETVDDLLRLDVSGAVSTA
jgi:diaminopimelate decarboxylase